MYPFRSQLKQCNASFPLSKALEEPLNVLDCAECRGWISTWSESGCQGLGHIREHYMRDRWMLLRPLRERIPPESIHQININSPSYRWVYAIISISCSILHKGGQLPINNNTNKFDKLFLLNLLKFKYKINGNQIALNIVTVKECKTLEDFIHQYCSHCRISIGKFQ